MKENYSPRYWSHLMEAKWYVYYVTQGKEDLPDRYKRWLEREQAKLDQKLAKAEAFIFE